MFVQSIFAGSALIVLLITGCQSGPQPTPAATPIATSAAAPTAPPTIAPPTATPTPEPSPTPVPPAPTPVRPTATPVTVALTATSGPDPVALGRERFTQMGCASCHGANGEGSAVAPRNANTALSFEQVLSQVRNPRGDMVSFPPSVLSDTDVQNIYAFLKSLR